MESHTEIFGDKHGLYKVQFETSIIVWLLVPGRHSTTYTFYPSIWIPSFQVPVNKVAADTDDKDGLLDYDFFHDRLSFLNFCEKNFYRFDTLRRAKHSSMMILHHLHASRARAMETMCGICNQNAVAGWHCETCSQFHVCEECYQREGQYCHVHELVKHLTKSRESSEQMNQQIESETDPNRKSKQIPELKASQVRL